MNTGVGKSPAGLYNNGSAQSANQINGGAQKNTVNINMNIMSIGLQGQLIGVNGPVQGNHNMMNMANMSNANTVQPI